MAQIGAILIKSDVLLVHLKKDPLFDITIPSKTQAYMAVGKPLLMAVAGDAADVVLDSGCGLVAESESAESIAHAVKKLFQMDAADRAVMGMNGLTYYDENFSLAVGVRKFGLVFEKVSG